MTVLIRRTTLLRDLPDLDTSPDAPPAYRQIATILRAAISAGTYRLGERVPKLYSLTYRYKIGDETASRALQILQAEGLIAGKLSEGAVVTALPNQTPSS